ncbi:nucleotidyltransferase family protein [Mesobacillus jeotgali]|uniref:nucleotidyltransferase family protein n=1 Tax=Mesobacillus jeotgali TaxID=129985 RepID=UPI001CFF3BE6|nr:nucleotidyltransferase family protein [Mesobacillus jeotgali]
MSKELLKFLFDQDFMLSWSEAEYNRIMNDIKYFRISPQVYMLLMKNKKLDYAPDYFQVFLRERYMRTLYINMLIKNELEAIFSSFESNKINMIPLKGVVFAEEAFGHLGARPTSDIDILVKKEDISIAIKLVKELGFEIEEKPNPNHFHLSFSKNVPCLDFPLTIEIHWDILKESTSDLDIQKFWKEAIPYLQYNHINQLSDYHTFYMICLHGWRHNMDSLKYFIDIIQLIYLYQDKLDYQRLFKEAVSHKTLKRIRRTLSIVYHQCPHLAKLKPLPQKHALLFWDYKVFRDKQHKSLTKYIDFVDYQLFSYDSLSHCLNDYLSLKARLKNEN